MTKSTQGVQVSDPENEQNEMQAPDELTVLKNRAKLMGITHGNNIGVEALKAKIAAKLNGDETTENEGADTSNQNPLDDGSNESGDDGDKQEEIKLPELTPMPTPTVVAPAPSNAPKNPFGLEGNTITHPAVGPRMGKQAAKIAGVAQLRNALKADALRMVRCRITNLDPKKKDLPGEVIAVGNRYVGTIKKFVPYGEKTEAGYHIEKILYDELSSRQFLHVKSTQDKRTGQIKVETKYVKEFAIEVLPPLTEQELRDLAAQQLAANG